MNSFITATIRFQSYHTRSLSSITTRSFSGITTKFKSFKELPSFPEPLKTDFPAITPSLHPLAQSSWSLIPPRPAAHSYSAESTSLSTQFPPSSKSNVNNLQSLSTFFSSQLNSKSFSHLVYYFSSRDIFFKKIRVPLASVFPKVYADRKLRSQMYSRASVSSSYRTRRSKKDPFHVKLGNKLVKFGKKVKKDPRPYLKPFYKQGFKLLFIVYGGKLIFGSSFKPSRFPAVDNNGETPQATESMSTDPAVMAQLHRIESLFQQHQMLQEKYGYPSTKTYAESLASEHSNAEVVHPTSVSLIATAV